MTSDVPISVRFVTVQAMAFYSVAREGFRLLWSRARANVKKDADAIKSQILEAMKANDKRKFKKALEEQYILVSRKGKLILWNEV
jgi:hypothetical protein